MLLNCNDTYVTKNEQNWKPYHYAAENGHAAVLKHYYYLKNKINFRTTSNRTALHIAAANKHKDACKILIEIGATVDAKDDYDETPLHKAAEKSTDVVKFLLSAGADVNTKNMYGTTPLHDAAVRGNLNVVEILLDAGADVNAKNYYMQTPLHVACGSEYDMVLVVLLRFGADINAKDRDGDTPLMVALEIGCADVVTVLSAAMSRTKSN